MNEKVQRCEVLVVGSGPGGSVTAWTLATQGKHVLLLEEGPNLRMDSCPPFSIEEILQKYRSGGLNPAVGEPIIPFVEGCCVGGGSEINSAMYHRTPAEVLALWKKGFHVAHLEPEHLSAHFEACEEALSVQLSPGPLPGPAQKMRLGAATLGWKSKEVARWFKYQPCPSGNGRYSGTKQSMTETLVPRATAAGCQLLPGRRAERIKRRKNHWEVSVRNGASSSLILADFVFLCCGAIQTPALLRRSGFRHNVGNSLAMHPTVKVVAIFPDEVNDNPCDVAAQQVTEFSPRACLGCSVSSLPHMSLAMLDHLESGIDLRTEWRRAAVYYAMIAGPSTGTIRNVPFSTDPLVRYALAEEHLSALTTALRNLCRLLFAAGASELYPGIEGLPPLRSDADLRMLPDVLPRRTTSLMTIHLFSSCRMGEDRQICAVDSFGKLYGQEGLFVNDSSVLCSAPGVNPQGTIMAIARRNALHFARAL